MKKDPNKYPPGWDAKRVQDIIEHYDSQTEEEELAEYEAAFEDETLTVMLIPNDLVQEVNALLAERGH